MRRRVTVGRGGARRVFASTTTLGIDPLTQEGKGLLVLYFDDPPWMTPWKEAFRFPEVGGELVEPLLMPAMPTMVSLAENGVRFRHFLNSPVCSPGRASGLTGVEPEAHGIGVVNTVDAAGALVEFGDAGFQFPTWPQVLEANGVRTGVVGKLHLSLASSDTNPVTGGPGLGFSVLERLGFGYASVTLRNLNQQPRPTTPTTNPKTENAGNGNYYEFCHLGAEQSELGNYGAFDEVVDPGDDSLYNTRFLFERAAEFTQQFGPDDRWCLYLPLNFAHSPFDAPPQDLVTTPEYTEASPLGGSATAFTRQMAMTEAMDRLLGEFLDGLPAGVREGLTIIVIADNGIDGPFARSAVNNHGFALGDGTGGTLDWTSLIAADAVPGRNGRFKQSIFRMGTFAQCLISGPDIAAPGEWRAPVCGMVDLAATICDYFGLTMPTQGKSLWPLVRGLESDGDFAEARRMQYFRPNGSISAVPHAPAYDAGTTYNPGDVVFYERAVRRWQGTLPVTGLDPNTNGGPNAWYVLGYADRRVEARLSGIQVDSGPIVNGVFSLIRFIADDVDLYEDLLFRMTDGNGEPVDLFEFAPLDTAVEYAAHYAAMLGFLGATTPPLINVALQTRSRDGTLGLLPVDANGFVPMRSRNGLAGLLEQDSGGIRLRLRNGGTEIIPLVPLTQTYFLPVRNAAGTLSGMPASSGGLTLAARTRNGGGTTLATPDRKLTVRQRNGATLEIPLVTTIVDGGGPSPTALTVRRSDGTADEIGKNMAGHIPARTRSGTATQLLVTSDTVTLRLRSGATTSIALA